MNKKWLYGAAIGLGLLVLAPTYTYVRREVANTWGAIQTFGYGATFTSTTQAINTVGTHLRKDADTGCWQEWQDGTLGWQLCADGVVPPDCTTAGPLEFGKFCKDQASGEVRMMTGSGLIALTGVPR